MAKYIFKVLKQRSLHIPKNVYFLVVVMAGIDSAKRVNHNLYLNMYFYQGFFF